MESWTIDISLWGFPASLILGSAFVLWIWAINRFSHRSVVCRVLAGTRTAVVLTGLAAAVLVAEGIWAVGLYHTWPFIFLMLALTASLGIATLRRLKSRPTAGFLLNHAGLFITLWGGLFGAPDLIEARMMVRTQESTSLAYTASGKIIPLPFEVRLERFYIDRYQDGATPRQFRSELLIDGKRVEVEVNSPARYGGYTFYQDGYDTRHGAYTVLQVVRDPWLWVVWCGIAMLAAGSILMLFERR